MSAIDGIGIDMEDVSRIAEMRSRWGADFVTKIFTDDEIGYCESRFKPEQHYAARFAAKEAFAKALGTGWRGQFRWKDIEIRNDALGRPGIFIHGPLSHTLSHITMHLSLSHTKTQVVAVVVFEKEQVSQHLQEAT